MLINRVEIENWGALRTRREYNFDAPGLNVVHGPNESGKSTLMQAIWVGLFIKPSSSPAEMQSLRTGQADTPAITIDFTVGQQRYRLSKKFKPSSATTMLQVIGSSAAPLQGDAAISRVQELLGVDEPSSSWTKLDWRRRYNLLWVAQGDQRQQPDQDSDGAGREDLHKVLETMVEEVLTGEHVADVLAQVGPVYRTYYSEKRGVKSGSPLKRAEELAEAAHDAWHQLRTARADLADLMEQVPKAQKDLEDRERAVVEWTQKVEERAVAVQRAAAARHDYDTAANERGHARKAADAASEARDQRVAAREELGALGAAAASKQQAAAKADAHYAEVAEPHKLAAAAASEAEAALAEAHAGAQQAAAVQAWHRAREANGELVGRVEKMREEQQRLVAAEAEVSRWARFDAKAVKNLSELSTAVKLAAQRWTDAQSLLRVRALGKTDLVIDGVSIELQPGESHDWRLASGSTLRLGDLAELTMETQLQQIDQLQQASEEASRKFDAALAALQVTDLAAAEQGAAALAEAKRALEQVQTAIRIAAPDGVAALEAQAQKAAAALAEAVGRVSDELQATWAERSLTEVQQFVRTAETAVKAATSANTQAKQRRDDLAKTLESRNTAMQKAKQEAIVAADRYENAQRALQASEARASDEQVEAALRAANEQVILLNRRWRDQAEQLAAACGLDRTALQTDAEKLAAQLIQAAKGLDADHQRAKDALVTAVRNRDEAQSKLDRLVGGLGSRPIAGLDAEAEAAEREALQAKSALDSHQLRAAGVKLLQETLQRHQGMVQEAAREPLLREVQTLLAQWDPSARVELDNELSIHALTRGDLTLETKYLSAGAREQLNFILRLAMARLMAQQGPVFMLLDDVFESTDDDRFDGMARLLADSADRLQIILFTWDLDRYIGLGAMNPIDITQATSGAP